MKKVHLVLGSGGARGMAHIGVIEMLEQDGYDICEVIGCSMGAVVGGIYCTGFLQEYKKWLSGLTKSNVFSLFDFTFTSHGFVKGDKIFNKIQEFTGEQQIEFLKIPFTAVSTDILHKKEVHFKTGNLFKALRSSIAIPGVFTPIINEDSILVDGGVLNPLPLNLVHKKEDEIVVAVNLNGPYEHFFKPSVIKENDSNSYWEWLPKFPVIGKKENEVQQKPLPKLGLFDLLNTSYDYTQDRLTELMIETYSPDLLIELPRNSCNVFEFYRADELIEAGKTAYKNAVALKNKKSTQSL
ncbi:MAG: patatin-like phospholipase family protein [Bacteroidota bacterium]|nr:patatin-like phospholipase family protein [Bacteroidota bacterium]